MGVGGMLSIRRLITSLALSTSAGTDSFSLRAACACMHSRCDAC